MLAQSKKGRVPLSSKERHLNANTALNRTSNVLESAAHAQQAALKAINEGKTRRAQHFLTVVSETIATTKCIIDAANANINSEQSSYAAAATRALAVADKRKVQQQGSVDPEKMHVANCRAYNAENKENVQPPSKRKSVDATDGRSTRRKSLALPQTRFVQHPPIDVSALRYHGPPLLPETLKGKLDKPPPPLNNKQYSPSEAMSILSSIQCETERASQSIRSKLRKHWIDVGLVPVKDSALRKWFLKHQNGEAVPSVWDQKGRPRWLPIEVIIAEGKILLEKQGRALRQEDWREVILRYQRQQAVADGLDPNTITLNEPSRSTLCLCHHIYRQSNPNVIALDASQGIEKTDTREIAENSFMSAVSLALVVGATHFYLCPPGGTPFRPHEDATEGAKLFYELAKRAFGGHEICCVSPYLVTSTDDMNSFIYRGTLEGKKSGMILVSQEAHARKHYRSIYSDDEAAAAKRGRRVKLGTTGTAAGQAAAPYLIVGGLTEEEMPSSKTPDGFICMALPSFAVGGTVNPGNKEVGYVVFTRSSGESHATIRRFLHQHKCYLEFISKIRQSQFSCQNDDEPPLRCTAVSWNDGASDQLVANRMDSGQFKKERVITNKQNAARTGTEQPEDLQRKYPIIRKEAEIKSRYQDDDELKTALQRYFEQALRRLHEMGILVLKPSHREAIIDFVVTLPEILQKAFNSEIIRQGFIENGFIDAIKLRSPDFYRMIAGTTRRAIKKEEMDNLKEQFVALMRQQLAYGYVDDDKLEAAGITPDVDRNGNKVSRNFPITSESRQRAKTLSHDVQKQEREEVLASLENEKVRKQNAENVARHKLLDDNKECEDRIRYLYMCRTDDDDLTKFEDAKIEDFAHASIPAELVKAFVHVREFKTSSKAASYGKWPNKGTPAEADRGDDVLTVRAFKLRSKPIKLQPITVDLAGDDSGEDSGRLTIAPTLLINEDFEYTKFNITNEWVQQVRETFHGIDDNWDAARIDDLKTQCDDLFECMKLRMKNFNMGLSVSDKPDHWVWTFARRNLHRVCAIMIMRKWIKPDVKRFITAINACLLQHPRPDDDDYRMSDLLWSESTGYTELAKILVGIYLYYDTANDDWMRSGKTERKFNKRLMDHSKGSKLISAEHRKSKFYTSFPSKDAHPLAHESRTAFYEDLKCYCAVGIDEKACDHALVEKDGMFDFTYGARQAFGRTQNAAYRKDRKLRLIYYLFEHVFELAMSKNNVVSQSKGFEGFICSKDD
jgi:hypothetical protein